MPFPPASESSTDVWSRGVDLLYNGDLVRASDCFEHVLEYDAAAADAWLGLHACREQREEAVRQMLRYHNRRGTFREATGLALESNFNIGAFVDCTLSIAPQVWAADVALMIDGGRFEEAWEALSACRELAPAAAP